jgi:SOS response regulatory protein OraA/RecX
MNDKIKSERSYVLWLLSVKEYSRPQLEKKLGARGLSRSEIDALLDDLKAEGIFRETAYQKARTRQLLKKGLGASLVKSRLRAEKCPIDNEDINAAYEEIGSDSKSQLRALIQKLLRRYERSKTVAPKDIAQKITRSLQSKGHSYSEITALLKEER